MKKILVMIVGILVLGGVIMAQSSPPWLSEMAPDGVLWGIGIAKQSSDSFSQIMAQSRARQSISYQLNSCIQAAITDYNRDAGTTGHIINTTLQESITRIVTSSQLNGSRITKTWRAPDGTFWCRAEYSKEEAKKWVVDVLKEQVVQAGEDVDPTKLGETSSSYIDHVTETSR